MEELVMYLAKSLVDNPDDVVVKRVDKSADEVTIELNVHPDDMGKVIGKQGRIAKAIRTVVKAAAVKEDKHIRYHVDIV
ncbi:KH domain-containing protein [Eubacteriales bacterium OttesenSCG-928-N14]|nr:KH domain-containing protein [Eubacteriales bacterium OttesenSCG-928-N14]